MKTKQPFHLGVFMAAIFWSLLMPAYAQVSGAFQEQGGQVVIEAEQGYTQADHSNIDSSIHRWIVRRAIPGASGSLFVRAEPDSNSVFAGGYTPGTPELRYQVQFATPGTYLVWLRIYAADDSGGSAHVGINGSAPASAAGIATTVRNDWTWTGATMKNLPAMINVPSAGLHTINLWAREDGIRIDRLLLTTDAGYVPSGMGPAESLRSDIVPPVRANGAPAGVQAAGTASVTLSLTTDESATCRYAATADTDFDAMTGLISTTGTTSHATQIGGLIDGQSYRYYVRCRDGVGHVNQDDYPIAFSVAEPPKYALSVAVSGQGAVSSNPAGINCGSDCSENYTSGSVITLTATPAAGQAFSGWGGACSGAAASCSVTMNAVGSVTAAFVSSIPAAGLIHHWSFDEGSGTAANDAVGTATGTVTASWTVGKIGNALNFNGTSGYVNLGAFSDIRGVRTISMWIKPNTVTGTQHLFLAGASGDPDHLQMSLGAGRPYGSAKAVYGSGQKRSSQTLAAGSWYNVVLVKSAGVIDKIYVNGVDTTTAAADYSGTGGKAVIGGYGLAGSFNGGIDDVRIYDRALSATEVQNLFNAAGTPGPAPSQYTLSTTVSGSGSITSNPAGINCGSDCSEPYASGAVVTLSATPAAGYNFSGWSGACTGTAACSVTMSAARSVTATFASSTTDTTPPVRSNGSPAGAQAAGTTGVTLSLTTGESATCRYAASAGTGYAAMPGIVSSTATTSHAAQIGNLVNGQSYTYYVRCRDNAGNVNLDDYVIAFSVASPPPSYALSVTRSGQGTVTSSPAGINCGSDCSESYASATVVTLSAVPASGYTFGGWSGEGCSGTSACTVNMLATRNVTAMFNSTVASDDLCQDLIQDKLAHPMSAMAKPAKGAAIIDPQFGTRIVRVTDVQNDLNASVAKPAYSTMPAWNADESYLILYVTGSSNGGHHLYNGKTYQYIRKLDIKPTDIEHVVWSSTDPDILYYTYSWEMSGTSLRQLIKYHVSTNRKDVMYDVPNAAAPSAFKVDMGSDPFYTSWDNDLFGLMRRASGSLNTGFTYRASTNTEGPRLAAGASGKIAIAPSGKYYVVSDQVMDTTTNARVRTMRSDTLEHGDMTLLENGHDVWASVQFDVAPYGNLITENLVTGEVKTIIGEATGYPYPRSGTHISGHAFKKPGWVAVSVIGNESGQNLLDQEILLANLNTGKVCRAAHHRSSRNGPNGYWGEPHVDISPNGTRLLFGSHWNGGSTVDAYVVELPSYKP